MSSGLLGARVFGATEVAAVLKRGVASSDVQTRQLVERGSVRLRAKIVQRMSAPAPRDPFWGKMGAGGSYLGVRTGGSRGRISPGGVAFKTLTGYRAWVGSPDAHVAFLEEGGAISGHPMLRIPTAAVLTPAGALKEEFARRSWRGIPGVFVWPNRRQRQGALTNKKPWLARASDGKLELLALLTPQVNLRGRHVMTLVAIEMKSELRELGQAAVVSVVKEAGR